MTDTGVEIFIDNDKGNYNSLVLNCLTMVITTIIFFINFVIFRIHLKKSILRKRYFKIVIIQIILQFIMCICLFTLSVLSIFEAYKEKQEYIIKPIFLLFNLCHAADFLYHIQSIICLIYTKHQQKNDDSFDFDINDLTSDEISESDKNESDLKIQSNNFKKNHIISFSLAVVHTGVLGFILLKINNGKIGKWYYYLILKNEKEKYEYLYLFTFHIIFFLTSIYYSCKKNRLYSLKDFIRCIILSSIINILIVISFCIPNDCGNDDIKCNVFSDMLAYFTLTSMMIWTVFRIRRYYIQFILSKNKTKNSCCQKFCNAIKIFFSFCSSEKIDSPNFTDYNNSFIYHALMGINDFTPQRLTISNLSNNLLES